MTSHYSKYDESTGRVVSHHSTSDTMPSTLPAGVGVIEGHVNAPTHYIVNSDVIPRPTFSLIENKTTIEADGADEYVVTGIPAGTKVTWPDQVRETINDGEIRFTVDLEGEYEFKFKLFPYRDKVLNVTAITPA